MQAFLHLSVVVSLIKQENGQDTNTNTIDKGNGTSKEPSVHGTQSKLHLISIWICFQGIILER